jgi:hypothetical protein
VRPGLAIPVAAACLLVLAGCLQAETPAPPRRQQGWTLDCSLGAHELEAGRQWPQECLARASHTEGHKSETWLAVNPTDPDNVIIGAKDLDPALSASCVWNGIFVTHDGGVSWKDVYISGKYDERHPGNPYYGYACNTDPMGAFTPDGTAHWLVEMYNFGGTDASGPLGPDPQNGRAILLPGWKLVLARSHDGGDTWPLDEVTTLAYGDGVAALNDYSRLAVNPKTGSVITMINTFYPAAGAFSLPVGGGVVCSILAYRGAGAPVQEVPVEPRVQSGTGNPGSLFCLGLAASSAGDQGTLVLGAVGSPSPTATGTAAWFANSTDDGRTWSDFAPGFTYTPIPGRFNESEYRTGTNFELAFDQGNGTRAGTLYVAYAADTAAGAPARIAAGADADVYVRSSHDQGRTWGEAVRVNLDEAGHQFMPNIAVAADGSVHAFFMDKAHDPAHRLIGITYARSDDGGATWTNQKVTTVPFDGDVALHQEGFPFIGDYIGIGAAGGTVWGAFPDTSVGGKSVVSAARVGFEG